MIRRTLAAGVATSVAAALLAPWGAVAGAAEEPQRELTRANASPAQAASKGTVLDLGTARGAETYIVQLEAPAVPTRELNDERTSGIQSTDSASAYRRAIVAQQGRLKASIARITGGTPRVLDSYTEAMNGIAVRLTKEQAQRVARVDGVSAVQVDFTRQPTTDRGPEWIGAPTIWDGSNVPGGLGNGNQGEGIVVGILDTGINPRNPSFADSVPESAGGDGYNHTNPRGAGNYVGVCATDPTFGCNDKLIGYWNYGTGTDRFDDDGHGSHTASTAAGNQVTAQVFSARGTPNEFKIESTIKGVAPHANIIGYDVCDGDGCQGTSIVAAIEQAILDEVDVINYSIGSSSPSNPWTDGDAVGFLNARAAGINVATSAGNDGPGAATVGSPADVPWITSVGATTHDRKYIARVEDLTATGGAPLTLPNIEGAGLSKATDRAYPLVYAGTVNANGQCLATGFPTGTDFAGQIVVCDRGGNGRVEKGQVVAALNAEGMILANNEASGDSLSGDAHALPAVHITYDDGVALKAWMASVTGEQASLSGAIRDIRPENGDIMASFSSRGPNRAVSLIGPSVSAPGVDILAAAGTNNDVEWQFISGTSMASPHTAGAMALLTKDQPGWSPAEVQSALMTTAERDITDSDGTVADWFDMGSGRIELRRAAKAGLVLDEDLAGYQAANPAIGGDVKDLNTASMADNECLATCEWTRTFRGTTTGAGTWAVSVENPPAGMTLTTDVATINPGEGTADVTVTATVAPGASTDEWLFGTLVLTPPDGSAAPVAHLPVGVLPSAGVLPDSIDITTRRDAGSQLEENLEAIAITDLQIEASGLVPEQRNSFSIAEDSTNGDPYDGNGTAVRRLDVPAGATRLIASLDNPTAPDFDLYVGRGEVSEANAVCASASGGSAESCEVTNPEAGNWWVLIQNWEATTPGGTDTTDLLTAVVAGDQGNLRAEGPEGPVPAATPFDIRTFWDETAMAAGETWQGALTLSSAPGQDGDIGVIPVTIDRIADDVTKTADKTAAAPGDVITYSVDVAPNVSQEDLRYTITDTLPEGTTYVEGSATNGAVYENGVVSWQGVLESTYGDQGNYTVRTSASDPSCVTPLGAPGYIDLAGFGITPEPTAVGDTVTFDAFDGGTFGFYGDSYQGLTFSDDGFLLYGDENYADAASEPWVAQQVPDPAKPNSVAALLWQDMELRYDAATGAGVTLADTSGDGVFEDGDIAVVEYDDMRYFANASGTRGQLDMQVFATAGSNDLVYAYDNITTGNGTLLGGAPGFEVTIGAENATASQAATLVNRGDANTVLSNGLNVCLDYAEPVAEAAGFTYQVLVGAVEGEKDLVNKVVHTTDDPGAKPASANYTVRIKGSAHRTGTSLALNPDQIRTGDTTAATATVFTSGATPATGQVQFYAGSRLAGTGTLDATGRATATLSGFTTAGTIPVTAKYVGDARNGPSTSAPANLVVSDTAVDKVLPRIATKMVKPVEIGKRVDLRVTVRARDHVPSGTVKILVKGAGKKKSYTETLNSRGRTKILLPRFRQTGKVTVRIQYLGDAATKAHDKTIKFSVVNRDNVR